VPNGWSIVLSWGQYAQDLDAHLRFADNSEVFWNNLEKDSCTLNWDVKNGWGPETITIPNGASYNFDYYVNNVSKEVSLAWSQCHVSVYYDINQVRDYYIPTNQGSANNWYVFSLNTQTGFITDVNTVTCDVTSTINTYEKQQSLQQSWYGW